MTVTKPQAQMLATLAAACRPIGARRWDTAGTMAAIAKVADRNLADVCLAVIRAASDRDAETPGVIPTNGDHWREKLAPQPFTPNYVDRAERCSVCSLSEPAHRIRWGSDHEFLSAVEARKLAEAVDPAATRTAINALKDAIEPTEEPAVPKTLDDLAERDPKLRAKVDAVRARLPAAAMRETEPPHPPASGEGSEAG